MKRNVIHVGKTFALALLFAFGCATSLLEAQIGPAQRADAGSGAGDGYQERLRQVATGYQAEQWPAGARRPGVALQDLEFPGFQADPLDSGAGQLERRFAGLQGLPGFTVQAQVFGASDGARAQLVAWLAERTSTSKAPAASSLGWSIGDVAYVGPSGGGPGAVSWIAFLRGNIAVRVLAHDPAARPQPELSAIATAIDRSILKLDVLAGSEPLPRPVIARFEAGSARVLAGEAVPLALDVQGSGSAEPMIEWTVAGTGQGYVERRDDGVFRLFTTGPGAIELRCRVTGSLGTVTHSAPIGIQVDAR